MMKRKKRIYAVLRVRRRALLGTALLLAAGFAALFTVSAATAQPEGVDVPVVMYHSMLKDESRHGKYVISPAEFENDLQYLKKHGYTTVLISDLIEYASGGRDLPERPILLTFDDGYYNNYLYAFEIAKRYRCKFVISPIAYYSDLYTDTPDENAYYSHCTWQELREMADSGLVEVQNHSYNLHKDGIGVKRLRGESPEAYRERLSNDLGRAQAAIEEKVGTRPSAFVYPFGAMSDSTPELVKEMGFSCTLSCSEKVSRVTRDPNSLYGLGRYLRVSSVSSKDFFEKKMGLS